MDRSDVTENSVTLEEGDKPEDDLFETTREEVRTTFEYQVQRLREIDNKAIEILKANLLLIGLVVTGGSILVQTDLNITPFLNGFMVTGVVLLLVSTGLAGVTYTSSNLRGGLDAAAVENAIAARHGELDEEEFEDRLLRSYGQWIEYNARITAVNDMFATVTVLLVIVAFVYLAAGLVVGLAAPGLVISVVAFLVQTVILLWLVRIIYRMDHLDSTALGTENTYDGVMLSKGATRRDGLVALREMLSQSTNEEE